MDISEILTMVGTYGGFSTIATIVGGVLYKRQNKRLKEAEAALAESNVDKAKIEGKADEFHIWKEQCEALSELNNKLTERNQTLVQINAEKEDRHQQDIKDWEARFDSQTDRLRSVQRDLVAANDREVQYVKQIAKVERERDHYKMWKCFREDSSLDPVGGCGRREPQQPIPIKYIPLEKEDCKKCMTIEKGGKNG